MFFVSTVVGEKSSDVEQSSVASAKLPSRRPPPHWTGRGLVKKGIMFGELSVFSSFFSLFFFSSFFSFLPGYVGVFVAHFHKCFLFEVS